MIEDSIFRNIYESYNANLRVSNAFPDYRVKTSLDHEEELRNAFVAITRAKRIIFLSYPQTKIMPWGDIKPQKPSRYLRMIGLI